jgi:hypothetical protein
VFSNVVFTIAVNATTVATSEYVVPGGKTLRLYAMNARVQNTAAAVGFGQVIMQVQYSTAAGASGQPVIAELYAAAQTSATGAAGGQAIALGGMDIPAGVTVKLHMRATGLTGAIIQGNVMGILYP